MDANAFRHLYGYHFAENRSIWDKYIVPLSDEQFTRKMGYSHESVCDQILHVMSADNTWFCEMRGLDIQKPFALEDFDDRQSIRTRWDAVEQEMRDYLAGLKDETLLTKPFPPGEDENLTVWQVLLHVANHGTDHRAQLLRFLNDLGMKTTSQDYIFYVYDNPT